LGVADEEFDLWLTSKYSNPFWVGKRRFEKTVAGQIRVDPCLLLFRYSNPSNCDCGVSANRHFK